MSKDFDMWNSKKKELNNKVFSDFYYEREIWWCSLGLNIGSEQDGKHEMFERPVIIFKKYSKNTALIIPITNSYKDPVYYHRITSNDMNSSAIISQLRTVSSNRLLRKIGIISIEEYAIITLKIIKTFL